MILGQKIAVFGPKKGHFGQLGPQNGLKCPPEAKDIWNGPQMLPPIAPDWCEYISGVLDQGPVEVSKAELIPFLGQILTFPSQQYWFFSDWVCEWQG